MKAKKTKRVRKSEPIEDLEDIEEEFLIDEPVKKVSKDEHDSFVWTRPLLNPSMRINRIKYSRTMPLFNSTLTIELELLDVTTKEATMARKDLMTRIA